ncbi:MAG: hypothetical protein RH946_00835 [Rhodospirillales bacterium]
MFAGPDNTSWGHRSSFVPTTWNPADKAASITLSNGDLTAEFTAGDTSHRAILGIDVTTVAAAYMEFTPDTTEGIASGRFGIALSTAPLTGSNHVDNAASWVFTMDSGYITNTSSAAYGSALTLGEVGMMAISDGKVWWGKEGTWFDSGDPETGDNPAFSGLTGVVYPYNYHGGGPSNAIVTANFGQNPFEFTPPAGFLPGWGAVE